RLHRSPRQLLRANHNDRFPSVWLCLSAKFVAFRVQDGGRSQDLIPSAGGPVNVTPFLGAMFSSLMLGHARQFSNGGTSEITIHSPGAYSPSPRSHRQSTLESI